MFVPISVRPFALSLPPNRRLATRGCPQLMNGTSPPVSAILAGMEQRFDLIVIPQGGDEQVRWPVLEDES